jgi:hypothetical protein
MSSAPPVSCLLRRKVMVMALTWMVSGMAGSSGWLVCFRDREMERVRSEIKLSHDPQRA